MKLKIQSKADFAIIAIHEKAKACFTILSGTDELVKECLHVLKSKTVNDVKKLAESLSDAKMSDLKKLSIRSLTTYVNIH